MKRRITAMGGRWLVLAAVAAGVAGCARPRVAAVYPQVAEYDGRRIEELTFVNPEPFRADSLDDLTETGATGCSLLGFLPFCFPGTDWGLDVRRLHMRTVGEDLSRLAALYRQNGYFGTRVEPEIDEVSGDAGPIHVRFVVRRGDAIIMDSVVVEGTEGIADPDSLESILPLQPGDRLDLNEFVASAETVVEALRLRGHAYAEVLRNYAVDTVQDRATVWLVGVPGPRVVVDSVLMDGLTELDRQDVRRQLTFGPSDLLRLRDLRSSQRNLYDLELVRFASVAVAPDSLQLTPEDSTTATVRVALSEAPEHVVEAGAGFATVECLRTRAQWTDRSVFGSGRKLTLTGSLSRIGVSDAVGGLEGVCQQAEDQDFGTELDYRLAADFTQPYFLSPANRLIATTYSERQSEPTLYQRTATGAQLSMVHRFGRRDLLTGQVSVEYRETEAIPLLYCFEFRACGSESIGQFLQGRWRNALTAAWSRNRSDSPLNPSSGYVLRTSTTWSTALVGSDYDFLRANLEGALYRPVGNGIVLAGFARFGTFVTRASLGPQDFVPPEERFFAGGASSVRGFQRFGLGPGLYLVENDELDPAEIVPTDTLDVDFVPTGGTSVAVLSAEARFPSPILRDLVRLAVFVDAGTVGLEPLWQLNSQWRATPGAGFRIQTPVGPVRVDVGYNPYPPASAPLFAKEEPRLRADLTRIADDFQEPARPLLHLDRFTLHIAVGQAF